jgi:hypothetical protein
MRVIIRWAILTSFLLGLAACASPPAGTAADAVQNYLQARVDKNVDAMIGLSCPDWEAPARVEAASFASMNAVLDNVACTDAGTDGDAALVTCSGQIVTTYNGEQREWPLEDFTYKVVEDGGEWRMCGYN